MTAIFSPSEMPGFTHPDVEDALSPSSDVSYSAANMMSNAHGIFPFSHPGAADILAGATWSTGEEGSQNFHDFHDSASVHPGDAEDYGHYPFHGHVTPRGLGQDSVDPREDFPSQWLAAQSVAPSGGSEPMKRGASRSSAGSSKHRSLKPSVKSRSRLASVSQSSKLSKQDKTGNAFRDGAQGAGHMEVKPHFLDSESSQMYYGSLPMDLGIPDGLQYPAGMALHVAPSQMQYDPDTAITDSPVSSWDALSAVGSSISSPYEESWSVPGMSPTGSLKSSPTLEGQVDLSRTLGSQPMLPENLHGSAMTAIPTSEDFALGSYPTSSRRQSEGDTAREHPLYKTAAPSEVDGLYHCPWEGDASCNHKPEKLKCNYDKFVDSHLKPYRCKIESCQEARFSSTACLLRHEREAHAMHGHGDKPFLCTYTGCDRAQIGNGFPRQWNLKDHMRRVHNDSNVPALPATSMAGGQVSESAMLAAGSQSVKSSSKGRKRKTDATEQPSSSRKSSSKSLPVADSYKQPDKALERWADHHTRLQKLAKRLTPDNLEGFIQIRDVLESMEEMSQAAASSQKQSHRRSYGN